MKEINEPTYVLPRQASRPQEQGGLGAVSIPQPLPRGPEFDVNKVTTPFSNARPTRRQVSTADEIKDLITEGRQQIADARELYQYRLDNVQAELDEVNEINAEIRALEARKLELRAKLDEIKRIGTAQEQLIANALKVQSLSQSVASLIVEKLANDRSLMVYGVELRKLPSETRKTMFTATEDLRPIMNNRRLALTNQKSAELAIQALDKATESFEQLTQIELK